MKLLFIGTRGEIDLRSRRHRRHTSLLVSYRRKRVMVDCGEDWIDRVRRVAPHAIVLTHAHPDHAWGLKRGAPCPVYATAETWKLIADYPIDRRMTIRPRAPLEVQGISFEAFPVEHSLRCPAVAYRVTAGEATVVYAPDLVYIVERAAALADVQIYIGDGASLTRPLIRRRGKHLIGHATVRTQLSWCQSAGVPRAIITHCGSQIVADHRAARRTIDQMGKERGIETELAFDGLSVTLR